tara:strand:+ start:34 stop:606 length:573 start_codon:yes stop_codon:yes gene_type:complete
VTVSNKIPFGARTAYSVNPNIPPLILQELTNQVKELTYQQSLIGSEGKETEHSLRTSSQCWLCWDTWVAGIMHNIFISANNDFFKYNLDHFASGIQSTRYEVGQEYGWHVDDGHGMTGPPRKLSMSLVLESEFTGGELEIHDAFQNRNVTFDIKPGHVVIFPSWLLHRVKPVTSGTRYSLVAWMNGPEFK